MGEKERKEGIKGNAEANIFELHQVVEYNRSIKHEKYEK